MTISHSVFALFFLKIQFSNLFSSFELKIPFLFQAWLAVLEHSVNEHNSRQSNLTKKY